MPKHPMHWGLALSGGAALGLANIGVLRALEKENLRPACIAGSSMGAIIGGLYAAGCGGGALGVLCAKLTAMNVAKVSERPFARGLHGGLLRQRLHDYLEPLVKGKRIGDCAIPFVCVAGRVRRPIVWSRIVTQQFTKHVRASVEPHVFSPETPLIDALMASSAIPVIFSPVEIGGEQFIDLCHFGSIPARSLREHCKPDIVIATDTMPRYGALARYLPKGWRAFLEAGYEETARSKQACDLIITPTLRGTSLQFHRAEEFAEAGYCATMEAMPDIRKLMQKAASR